jgi:hypothetical protein
MAGTGVAFPIPLKIVEEFLATFFEKAYTFLLTAKRRGPK